MWGQNRPLTYVVLLLYIIFAHKLANLFILFLASRERHASIVLERYFRFEMSLLSILCKLIARMEMGTSWVLGDSDIIT